MFNVKDGKHQVNNGQKTKQNTVETTLVLHLLMIY